MARVELTVAQARRMGIKVPGQQARASDDSEGARSVTRRRSPLPQHTVCQTCGEHLHGEKAESGHVDETGHARYELVLVFKEKGTV